MGPLFFGNALKASEVFTKKWYRAWKFLSKKNPAHLAGLSSRKSFLLQLVVQFCTWLEAGNIFCGNLNGSSGLRIATFTG